MLLYFLLRVESSLFAVSIKTAVAREHAQQEEQQAKARASRTPA